MVLTFTISTYWAFLIILVGFLSGVMGSLAFVKGKRGEGKMIPWYELILSGIFFGALAVLIVFIFSKEVQEEDKLHHHWILISQILMLCAHIALIFCLYYFGIIVPIASVDETTDSATSLVSAVVSRII